MSTCLHCSARATLFLCRGCGDRLRGAIDDVPELARLLVETFARQNRFPARPSAIREPPATVDEEESALPFIPEASEALDQLRTVAMRWTRDLAEQLGMAGPVDERTAGPARIDVLSRWLGRNLIHLLVSEDAPLALDEFERAVERARAAIDIPDPPVYRGPCPDVVTDEYDREHVCGTPLYAPRGDAGIVSVNAGTVTCVRCGAVHDLRELKQRLLAELADYLMPSGQILRVMRDLGEPVSRSTWHRWRKQGKVRPRGYLHAGRVVGAWVDVADEKLYRLDDVREVRRASATADAAST